MKRRPQGMLCAVCPGSVGAAHFTRELDGTPQPVCEECFRETRRWKARRDHAVYKSPYPGGNRNTFFAALKTREKMRLVTEKFVNATNVADLGHGTLHRRKQGDVRWDGREGVI